MLGRVQGAILKGQVIPYLPPYRRHGLLQVSSIEYKAWLFGAPGGAQLDERLTSAQVLISQFVSSSLASDSVLTAWSLEPASDSVCLSPSLSLSLPLSHSHSVSLSLSLKNK